MKISPATLDHLRETVILSELIGQTVPLQQAGQEWKACCPFHDERSPSFTVNDAKGFYHCFGCGAHGDAIQWLVKQRSMTLAEAIGFLAHEAKIELPDPEASAENSAQVSVMGGQQKRGGGKLSRSETVTVRLDPKLNYLCELAARAQRRTKSSYIEWAIANSLGSVVLADVLSENTDFECATIKDKSTYLWHVDEADRLAYLALVAPSLLTHEQQLIWKIIRENGFLWRGNFNRQGEWSWEVRESSLIKDRLRDNWDLINAVAASEKDPSLLPTWKKKSNGVSHDELDDDIPF